MFERFTERARRVVVQTQHEARALDHGYIGTEHILLALIREGGTGARLLAAAGVDNHPARQQVTELLHGRREASHRAAPPPAATDELLGRLTTIASRLDTIERRLRQSSSG